MTGDGSQIARVRFHTLRIPLPYVVFLGDVRIAHREFAICLIDTRDGTTGWGVTLTRGTPVETVARNKLLPLLQSRDADAVDALWERMIASARAAPDRGVAMRAVSMTDIALWDVKARRAKMPVCRALGGAVGKVPILTPAGYRREGEGAVWLRRELEHYAAQRIPAVKLMLTAAQVVRDPDVVVAARSALGEGIKLGVDLLGSAPDVPAVESACCAVSGARLDFVEDPFEPLDIEKLRGLRWRIRSKLVTGEKTDDDRNATELVSSGAIDAVRFDATVCGGVTGWMRMQSVAAARGLPIWPHVFPEIHAHLAVATGQPYVESPVPPYETMNLSAVLDGPSPIHDGHWHLSECPGWGFELNEERFGRFIRDGSEE